MPQSELSDWGDEVFRLYGATLGRDPDAPGYVSWVTSLSNGSHTMNSAVQAFVATTEFQNTYGALDNASFVTLL
jgi:hypothetical protein